MKRRVVEAVLIAVGLMLMASGIAGHLRALAAQRAGAAQANAPASASPSVMPSGTFAVVGARVFDGTQVIDRATVIVEHGVIQGVGRDLPVPAAVAVVDGAGRTLLPGLIDAHTHAFGGALERALVFGVTTELDMFTDHEFAASMRREQRKGNVPTRADLFSAGTLITAPGGHGTEFGIAIPTLARPEDAQAFVDARIAEGSDYIKIIDDDGAMYGYAFPTLTPATVKALVDAAHRRGKLAVIHIATARAARRALEAGVDGLAHAFADVAADAQLVALARDRHAFVIPTLTVIASSGGDTAGASGMAADRELAPYLDGTDRRTLDARFPAGNRARPSRPSLAAARDTVSRLRAGGVTLLAGTDAPNPGTAHGVSMHHELALLTESGLTPSEALAAATATPARVFGLADRGRIAPGLRADLLLVEGDPTRTITDTRRIVAVWKGGAAFTRRGAERGTIATAAIVTDGTLSEFEGDLKVGFGSGWQTSADTLMGGASQAAMRVVEGGANGSRGSLEITGSIKPGSAYPWAGAICFPGPQPMAPANLSRFKSLVFWTRGDGGSYRVLVFAAHLGNIPVEQPFTAGAEWREVVMPFAAFGDVDGRDVAGILFSAGPGQATFRLQIDGVRFRGE